MNLPPVISKSDGFTLIEILIVVVIIGVLGAIAVPSYSEYVRRGHRADARAGLLQAQQWLERSATANGLYPGNLPATLSWTSDKSKRYTINYASTSDKLSYTLTARRRTGAQASDRCGDLTLTHNGVQGASSMSRGATVYECWHK